MNNQNDSDDTYARAYSDPSFWEKVTKFALSAGKVIIKLALDLYYALQDENTPAWAKAIIIAALGYFISPIDAIPDITPVVGYSDDLGVLTMALATVGKFVTDEVKANADKKLQEWFKS